MFRNALAVSLLLLCSLPSCSRTQDNARRDQPLPTSAAEADTAKNPALKKRLISTLDKIAATVKATRDTTDEGRIAAASYATYRSFAALARAWDRGHEFAALIDREDRDFAREDSLRKGPAGKIMNGMLGIHAMVKILYSMRFAGNPARMDTLELMEQALQNKLQSRAQGIAVIASVSNDVFWFCRSMLWDMDREQIYAGHLEQIDQVYQQGAAAAVTDEDRFLNGLYRSFEVCQVWALLLDPGMKTALSDLNRQLVGQTQRREGVGHQMATGVEFLYKVTDYLARTTISRSL